jgi:hypothetical protein
MKSWIKGTKEGSLYIDTTDKEWNDNFMELIKKHGGKRPGAGRKPKEPTKTIRVPVRLIPEIMKLIGK